MKYRLRTEKQSGFTNSPPDSPVLKEEVQSHQRGAPQLVGFRC